MKGAPNLAPALLPNNQEARGGVQRHQFKFGGRLIHRLLSSPLRIYVVALFF